MPLNKKFLARLRTELHEYAVVRRDVINLSGNALHLAKRAIFSLHRGHEAEAEKKLEESSAILGGLVKQYKKYPNIRDEGAFEAAMEELVEATLFYQFVKTGNVGDVQDIDVESEQYIAGLCDLPGELYRYAIRAATKRDHALVERCASVAGDIIGELTEFDLTSYLRTKFDQAKSAHQKLEEVVYELSLRHQ